MQGEEGFGAGGIGKPWAGDRGRVKTRWRPHSAQAATRASSAAISATCWQAPITSPVCPDPGAGEPGQGQSREAGAQDHRHDAAERQAERHGAEGQHRTEAEGGGEARPVRAPHCGGEPAGPGRLQQHHRGEGGDPRQGGGQDQAGDGGVPGPVEERGQGADPQGQGQDQGRAPVGADPAVAHDLQAALPGGAAAEPVGDVGEPVLVQGARGHHQYGDGERRGQERPEPDPPAAGQDQGRGQGQDQAGQRQHPGQGGEVGAAMRVRLAGQLRHRQAGVEAQAPGEVVEGAAPGPVGLPAGLPVHRGLSHPPATARRSIIVSPSGGAHRKSSPP